MRIIFDKNEYSSMQKEVCYLMNDLRQLTDTICSSQFISDHTLQANATCSAQEICDLLKNYLIQMNFISYSVANGGVENEFLNQGTINNSFITDGSVGDNMELFKAEEGNSTILEDSKPEDV